MSRFLLLVLLSLTPSLYSYTQNTGVVKQYVYERSVTGGAMAVDENGRPRNKRSKQYLVYIETSKSYSPTISAVYINGLSYSGKAIKVASPVVIDDNPGEKETLVKKTANQVWQVMVSRDETMARPAATLSKTINTNAFVLKGFLKGKAFTAATKKIIELHPLMAE